MALATLRAVPCVAALAALALLSSCSSEVQAREETVTVRIHHSRFSPDSFVFRRGSTVTFVVANGDPIAHEFILGDDAVQQRHESGSEPHHGAIPGEISVPAGERRTTTVTLDEPGELIFGCHLPSHYAYGMRGTITVSV